MADLRLIHLDKKFDNGVEAVKDFNLDIKDKEFVILVGPSGCGKTTVIRMISGLCEPTKGDIYIDERCVDGLEPQDRNIAVVFQNYALFPYMSVYENMAFALKLRSVDEEIIHEKVMEVARMLDIEDLLKRKPRELSGGQRQRVSIGRALVREPKVLLMDEPLSSLDAKLRVQMRAEIANLHKKLGSTIVYVTHDQVEAMTLGDRIVVMNEGAIQQVDSPKHLYDYPDNLFVAGFIGSPQMNFIDVEVVLVDGEVYLNSNGINFKPNAKQAEILKEKAYLNKKIVLGIRPENIHVQTETNQEYPNKLVLELAIYELTGNDAYLHFNYLDHELIVRVNSSFRANEATNISLYLDADAFHLFDKESGKAIRNG